MERTNKNESPLDITCRLYVACEKLKEALKEYKDTGLTPEEIRYVRNNYTLNKWENVPDEELKKILSRAMQSSYGVTLEQVQELAKAKEEGRIILLPVPIGGTIFVPYKYKDVDGTIESGIEEAKLSGYVKEGDKEFYTTYDERGCNDYEPGSFYLTREEAEPALVDLEAEEYGSEAEEGKCRVCGCTWNTPCEGGCYWVEDDLCSKCAEEMEDI
ncbi:hypothetical protein DFR58_101102 [Anaerobacterium chartisolvens]|uniref:Uncharacterized protein n=1 Tax=Anaerobacterium chartisolvens TaxID=1297424 RepID=A0A369BH71_9FIRM|nr:hypothetical protein [Anaerobacterium chartisolvens]RCX20900.1 hypothetical protein DFR58_101102 [Anaerobacterium chartisolvens]